MGVRVLEEKHSMKSIFIGIASVFVAMVSMAVPAAATFSTGNSSGYAGANASISTSGYSRIGIKNGKIIFEGESVTCFKGNAIVGGMYTSNQQVNQTTPTLPSADTSNCNPTETVNNPPQNSTVTITGFCDDDAAKLKANVSGANVKVIINSTGSCDGDDDGDQVITVTPDAPKATGDAAAKNASVSSATSNPKAGGETAELPTTGAQEVITAIIATVLAGGTYAGVMAVRSRL